MRSIIAAAVRHRALGNVAFVLVAVIGLFAYVRLPVDAWPEVSLDEAWITTMWHGAGAEEIELLVTRQIEDEIKDIRGIDRIVSNSAPNISTIDVKFDEDLSPEAFEACFNDLRTALDRVVDLPADAERPVLQKLTTSEIYPIFQVAIAARDPALTEIVIREVARDLKRELEKVPGVTRIRYSGYRDRELRVEVDRLAARRHGVDLRDIAHALTRTGSVDPAGSLSTLALDRAGREEVRIKQDEEFDDAWQVLEAVVRQHAGGPPVLAGDVATLRYGFEKRRFRSRFNGMPAIMLNIAKDDDSNILRLRDACSAVVDAMRDRVPAGIEFGFTADSTQVVRSRFGVLIENLLQGFFLVTIILWAMLGLRNALIALVGIPFSFLMAVLFFPALGLSINNLTLFGLVLVGGMLVDDAVVVLENIYRRIESGEPAERAVIEGASEVAWPVINAVSTTMAAMVPLLIQGGVTGKFFAYIPKVVILTLICSLIQCFTVLPIHYIDWGARRRAAAAGKRPGRAARARERGFALLNRGYVRILGAFLRHRLAVIVLTLGATVFLVGRVLEIPQDPWTSDFNAVFIAIECDASYSLDRADEAVAPLEERIEALRREGILESYSTTVGFSMTPDGVFILRPNVCLILAELVDTPAITANPERLLERIRGDLDAAIAARPEDRIESVRVFPPHDGPPLGRPVAVRVDSTDYEEARAVAVRIQAALRSMPGVSGIADNYDPGPLEYRFRVDPERASRLGIFPRDAGLALRAANDGLIAGDYRDGDEDVAIRVLYDESERRDPADLLDVDVRTPAGAIVPLGDLVRVETARPNALYYHYDTRRTVLVTAEVDAAAITGPEVNRRLQERFADVVREHPGVRLHFGGEFEETQKSMGNQRRSFWIAVVLIYLLLVAQFRSYAQPLVVLATVPFSVLGVLIGLLVREQPFTIPTFIAIVGLAGVVVNESLVMVDFINRLRRERPLLDAIIEGSRQRLRPILITSLTTIANLMPLAFGLGGTSKVWTPFAVSIVFGLGLSTLVTLFLTPIFYSLVSRAGSGTDRAG